MKCKKCGEFVWSLDEHKCKDPKRRVRRPDRSDFHLMLENGNVNSLSMEDDRGNSGDWKATVSEGNYSATGSDPDALVAIKLAIAGNKALR